MNGVLVHFCLPSEFLQLDNIMVTRSVIGVYNESKPQLVKLYFFYCYLFFLFLFYFVLFSVYLFRFCFFFNDIYFFMFCFVVCLFFWCCCFVSFRFNFFYIFFGTF